MSHALLLRLFLSPSFFSVHVALQYLRIYPDSIGITYYLTKRLREYDTRELREVWGFICHLLVTRPSQSRALECFVVEIAQKSTHVAMLTLWFMQAHLKDLSAARHNSDSFLICQRVLNQCHEMIYGELPSVSAPYSSLSLHGVLRKKVKPNAAPALVGMGMILAGIPAMPQLTEIMGEVAIEQGRIDAHHDDLRSLEHNDSVTRLPLEPEPDTQEEDKEEADGSDPDSAPPTPIVTYDRPGMFNTAGRQASHKRGLLARRKTIGSQTSPALPLHLKEAKKPRLSEDPFGQYDPPSPKAPVTSPFASTPTLTTSTPRRMNSFNTPELLLQKYDRTSQTHMLRSHFCRSEIQFVLALENICNRLLVVPKPARVSALRYELTGLNHMLPAEICLPMWCYSSDTLDPTTRVHEPHHRIVRIPPGESVVLNSAERAPYLLLVEILHTDLDFDPEKRANKEVLKKIVTKENERQGASNDLIAFNGTSTTTPQRSSSAGNDASGRPEFEVDTTNLADGDSLEIPTYGSITHTTPPEEEEIDLVEQLYGDDNDIRALSMDLSETVVLPAVPKNRELDMATWSRSTSGPGTPNPDSDIGASFTRNSTVTHKSMSTQSQESAQKILSLDEYSERMRTAAVMLAQLNANLVKEPATTITAPNTPNPAAASESSNSGFPWLPGSGWLTVRPPDQNGEASSQSGQNQNLSMRMRLQPTEAARIRERIMDEMLALEEERMERMRENRVGEGMLRVSGGEGSMKTAEDEGIIRRELSKADPSAVVMGESWAAKKARIRQASPYGHLANWECVSVIVKTGGDLRQEQLAVQLILEFDKIWKEENCACWVRYFRILITGRDSGLMETITDAVSIHSIKKAEYARRLATGRLGHVTLYDHFKNTYGNPASAKFLRAQRNFAKSLAGYSVVTYLLQIKDRHNGNILLDRDGHLIHIDFGFMLSNSPGNIGFEAAPFKLPLEYIEVLGGTDSEPYKEFRKLFKEGFEAARKHCDRVTTLVELMQKDSTLPCFAALGEQTASQLRDRFQQGLTQSAVEEHLDRLIDTSLGSNWTRLYDSYQYYSQSIL